MREVSYPGATAPQRWMARATGLAAGALFALLVAGEWAGRALGRLRGAALLLAALALSASGCRSDCMKATPLYSGGPGPAAERVNLWPAYYKNGPDVSALWPVFEKTPDHLALRPIFSAYKLDRPARQYNVLWPLAQFDFEEHSHRVFPFFWGEACGGENYFVAFPGVWWYPDLKGILPVFWWERGFTLFPLVWYQRDDYCHFFPLWLHSRHAGGGQSTHLAWPVFHWKDTGQSRGARVWPLFGDYRARDGSHRYSFALWPLGHYWRDGEERLRAALPFYVDRVGQEAGWRLVSPVYFHKWGPERSLRLTPLWAAGRRGQARWSALVPLYYRGLDPEHKTDRLITPLVGRIRSEGRTRWLLVPLASSAAWGPGEKDIWALGPLAHARWGGSQVKSHVFPLYYYDREKKLLVTPPLSRRRGEEGFYNLLGLAAHYSWDRQGTRTLRLLPPLTAFGRGPDYRRASVYPLFSWHRSGGYRDLWVFPWMRFESEAEEGRRASSLFPLWSYSARSHQGGRDRDFRVLGWLYESRGRNLGGPAEARAAEQVRTRVLWKLLDYERTGADRSLDVFPFFSWDRREDGHRRFAFVWRLFRYERRPDGARSLDLLFLPVMRRAGAARQEG